MTNYFYVVNFSKTYQIGHSKSDHNKQLITLSVITLIDFHCIKKICVLQKKF